jgi:DNA-binding NarL/FixJ family response regulator
VIKVLIVDDQSLIRVALIAILAGVDDFDIVGEAADGAGALDLARRLRPDVILMDIRMPVMDGIEATAAICNDPELAQTRVLIFTTFEEDHYVADALVAGASGFLGKGADPDEIVQAIRTIRAGDALLSSAATRSLIARYLASPAARHANSTPALAAASESLTPREREILSLVGRGHTNDDIAASLVISPHTAKTHIGRIMMKLDAHDRAQLVIYAYETGLVTPGDQTVPGV